MSNVDLLSAYFEPGIYNSQRATPGVDLAFHPQFEVLNQGTSWHKAGLATTDSMHNAIATVERALYPEGIGFTELRVWETTDPDAVFVEWRNAATMHDGREMANGGLSLFQFDQGAVRWIRHFQNVAYQQAIEAGWHNLVSYDVALRVPAFRTLRLSAVDELPLHPVSDAKFEDEPAWKYPEPWTNEQRVQMTYDPAAFEMRDGQIESKSYYGFTEDAYVEWQGTKWTCAGRNYMKDVIAAGQADLGYTFHAHPWLRFTHVRTWATADQEWVFLEWFSKSEMWSGLPFRNHGMTAMQFTPDGDLVAHREYCNVAYNEAQEGDWRDKESPKRFAVRATAKTWDVPSDQWTPSPIYDTATA